MGLMKGLFRYFCAGFEGASLLGVLYVLRSLIVSAHIDRSGSGVQFI